jgi:hypothetical protein
MWAQFQIPFNKGVSLPTIFVSGIQILLVGLVFSKVLPPWVFQRSKNPFNQAAFFSFLGFTPTLCIASAEFGMSGHYTIALWCAIGEVVCGAFAIWFGLGMLNRRARLLWSSVLSAILIFGVVGIYRFCCPPVTIRPSQVVFDGQGMSYTFTVRNFTDKDMYLVVPKLSFSAPPDDFKLDTPLGEARVLAPVPNGLNFTDITGAVCKTQYGSYNIYIFIYRLIAGESREFSLTYKGSGIVPVHVAISHFQIPPLFRDRRPQMIATPMIFDENCTPVSFMIVFK